MILRLFFSDVTYGHYFYSFTLLLLLLLLLLLYFTNMTIFQAAEEFRLCSDGSESALGEP